jgi:hypothetical protein
MTKATAHHHPKTMTVRAKDMKTALQQIKDDVGSTNATVLNTKKLRNKHGQTFIEVQYHHDSNTPNITMNLNINIVDLKDLTLGELMVLHSESGELIAKLKSEKVEK